VGDEQAETYLRLLAEAETRRTGRGSGPDLARSADRVRWAGNVLITVGLLTPDDVERVATELEAALLARSDQDRPQYGHRMSWILDVLDNMGRTEAAAAEPPPESTPPESAPPEPGGGWRVIPVGRRIRVAHDRAPSDLYLMTLVRSPDAVAIAAAMRMHWPDDGSSADLEITGAGPQHLPYDELWAADDRGNRYRVEMSGEGGTLTWQGEIWLHDRLPPDARWLDLVADGTQRLARINLNAADIQPTTVIEPVPEPPPGERMLTAVAERLLASARDRGGPRVHARLGETMTVLAGAGALAADSPVPARLAALCQRLGVRGHGIAVPAAAQIPARWTEVLPSSADDPPGPEWFVPLGPAAADLEGTRFVLAGLASAGGQSFLHVVAQAPPRADERLPLQSRDWKIGFSWWVRDDAGGWHLGTETDPGERSPGLTRGTAAFRLRLTPPLRACPQTIEVEVTGRLSRARAVVAPTASTGRS
jgi:hypothetical protein